MINDISAYNAFLHHVDQIQNEIMQNEFVLLVDLIEYKLDLKHPLEINAMM